MITVRSSRTTTARSAALPTNLVTMAVAAEHLPAPPEALRRRIADGTLTAVASRTQCSIRGKGNHLPAVSLERKTQLFEDAPQSLARADNNELLAVYCLDLNREIESLRGDTCTSDVFLGDLGER